MAQCYEFPPTPIPTSPTLQSDLMQHENAPHDPLSRCVRCGFGGCDMKAISCSCHFHARCFPIGETPLDCCPKCGSGNPGFTLLPMSFDDINDAQKSAALAAAEKSKEKRGRKRKNSMCNDDASTTSSKSKATKAPKKMSADAKDGDLRTGRWSAEEMAFCDKLIFCFKEGILPVEEGTKLNDFLASLLKSKQSRLTKKMKNAKLSSNTFVGKTSYITNDYLCYEFSAAEDSFFNAISDATERAELRFHMSKLWKEMLSNHCLNIGQPIDVDAWLSSVEEMDRRKSMARDAARMKRRKLMMGYALCQDSQNAQSGIFIEGAGDEYQNAQNNEPLKSLAPSDVDFNVIETQEMLAILNGDESFNPEKFDFGLPGEDEATTIFDSVGKSSTLHSSPFLKKVISYVKRHKVPFEHIDIWVPNFPDNGDSNCVLGFAGSATSDQEIPASGVAPATPMDSDTKFNLLAFGDYSQKFSFSVGCGLPGRVFQSNSPKWELATNHAFERSGGALQWGIKSVLGIPISSPSVGRIVMCLYSRYERVLNQGLVSKLTEEFTRLFPVPKWKLVIDMGTPSSEMPVSTAIRPLGSAQTKLEGAKGFAAQGSGIVTSHSLNQPADPRILQIVNLLADHMTSPINSNLSATYNNDMISLRLLLLKPNRSIADEDIVSTIVASFSSYKACGRPDNEIATMVARDYSFMLLNDQGIPEVSVHHMDYNLGGSNQGQFDTSEHIAQNFEVTPTLTEFSPLDPKIPFYFIDGFDPTVRPNSPALTPIESHSDNNIFKHTDSLSVVSN